MIGRNRKGRPPRLAAKLRAEFLAIECAGVTRLERTPPVTGRLEAMIAAAKLAKGPMVFGVPRLTRAVYQPRLPL